jgi:antitoxin ParD1/3/4
MATINLTLPDSLVAFLEAQVRLHGYGSGAEYVEELIRKEQDRLRLREVLLEGQASEPGGCADTAFFERLRGQVIKDVEP